MSTSVCVDSSVFVETSVCVDTYVAVDTVVLHNVVVLMTHTSSCVLFFLPTGYVAGGDGAFVNEHLLTVVVYG